MSIHNEMDFYRINVLTYEYKNNHRWHMLKHKFEYYLNEVAPLSPHDQLALVLSLNANIESGRQLIETIEKIYVFQHDDSRSIAVWMNIMEDLKVGTTFGEALVKTGFFSPSVETIFLTVQDPQLAFKAIIDFFRIIRP